MKKGFTLIELLLVIAILGILTVLGLFAFTSSLQAGRDSKRKSELRQMGIALEAYYADKGKYPLGAADGTIIGCSTPVQSCTWGTAFTDGVTMYMVQLPQDSITSQQYYYVSDGTKYQIYAHMENSKDSDVKAYNGPECVGTDSNSCNYGIASTNTSP